MPLTPTLLLVPSVSAGQILLRLPAREQGAIAAISAMRPKDLALKIAEANCHALGLLAGQSGHGALLSAKLLASPPELLAPGLPEAPVARVLARTLEDLRAAVAQLRRYARGLALASDSHQSRRSVVFTSLGRQVAV